MTRIRVVVGGTVIADCGRALRVLETAGAPVYYVRARTCGWTSSRRRSTHPWEWKGDAGYWSVAIDGRKVENVAWSYEAPKAGSEPITGHLAFYAWRVDEAWVGD